MSITPNVRDLLEGHIGLELESIDRLYLNGYVAQLQHGAGLVGFLSQQRGHPIASPALLGQITGSFVAEVKAFAKEQGIPLFHFERNESKDQRAHQLRRERSVRDALTVRFRLPDRRIPQPSVTTPNRSAGCGLGAI